MDLTNRYTRRRIYRWTLGLCAAVVVDAAAFWLHFLKAPRTILKETP